MSYRFRVWSGGRVDFVHRAYVAGVDCWIPRSQEPYTAGTGRGSHRRRQVSLIFIKHEWQHALLTALRGDDLALKDTDAVLLRWLETALPSFNQEALASVFMLGGIQALRRMVGHEAIKVG